MALDCALRLGVSVRLTDYVWNVEHLLHFLYLLLNKGSLLPQTPIQLLLRFISHPVFHNYFIIIVLLLYKIL